jgi:hypothetical protein
MADQLEWIRVDRFGKAIGAVGFLGNSAVAVVAFYDDADADKDGSVSLKERVVFTVSPLALNGMAATEVAMQGMGDPSIVERDPEYRRFANGFFQNFTHGLMLSGVYTSYFTVPVRMIGSAIASQITTGMVKQFFVRKGFEAAVRSAMLAPFR